MARSVRIEFPGAYYHVLARGNRRKADFWIRMIGASFCNAWESMRENPLPIPRRGSHADARAVSASF